MRNNPIYQFRGQMNGAIMNPLMKRGSFILVTTVLILGLGSCSDDDPVTPPTVGSGYVTILVDETTYPDSGPGIVFTSALDGTVMGYATWTGAAELQLAVPTELGAKFFITEVWDAMPVELSTMSHVVTADLELDWRHPGVQPGHGLTEFQFDNIPECDSYTFSSGGRAMSGNGQLGSSGTVSLRFNPADVLVILRKDPGLPSYLWVEDVPYGSTQVVDLVGLTAMEQRDVNLPSSDGSGRFYLNGIEIEPDLAHPIVHPPMINRIIPGPLPGSVGIEMVPAGFEAYRTRFVLGLEAETGTIRSCKTEGGWPAEVSAWDLGIEFEAQDVDGFLIRTTGEVGNLVALWIANYPGEGKWDIGGVVPGQEQIVPQVPEELLELIPDLDRESMALFSATATRSSETVGADGTTPMTVTELVTRYTPEVSPQALDELDDQVWMSGRDVGPRIHTIK